VNLREGLGAVTLAALASLVAAIPSTASAASSFTLVGGERSRTVEVAPCVTTKPRPANGLVTPTCLSSEGGSLSGALSLVVSNTGANPGSLRLHFIQNGAATTVGLFGPGPVALFGAVQGGLFQRTATVAARSETRRDVLNLLLQIGTRKRVPAVLLSVRASGGRLNRLKPGRLRSLITAMDQLLRPRGMTLAIGGKTLRRLLFDISAVAKARTTSARRLQLNQLAGHVRGLLSREATVNVAARATTVVALRLDLPRTTDPKAIGGLLQLAISGTCTPVTFNLPVAVKPLALSGVTIEPSTIGLQRRWPGTTSTQAVSLWGPGVSALFASRDTQGVTVNLGGSGSAGTTVVLSSLQHDRANLDHATATVSLSGSPSPGTYNATIPLSRAAGRPPALTVAIKSSITWWIAFLLILCGVLLGGFAPRVYALRQRRETLGDALADAVENYGLRAGPGEPEPTSWNLSGLLGPPVKTPDGVVWHQAAVVYDSIRTARDDADLDASTTLVLDIVARVQRWLRLEPATRRLRLVVDGAPANTMGTTSWSETNTSFDGLVLLRALKNEPADAAAADDLAARILWQTDWCYRFGAAWRASSDWDSSGLMAIDRALTTKTVLDRTAADRTALGAQLDRVIDPSTTAPTLRELERARTDGARTDLADPDWRADPMHFTGWATLDGDAYLRTVHQGERSHLLGPGYDRLSAAAPTSPGAPKSKIMSEYVERGGDLVRPSRPRRALQTGWRRKTWSGGDAIVTAVLLAGASAVYLGTIYNSTWGSTSDLVTAAAAGFGAALIVQWAALPVFQSRQLHPAGTGGTSATDGAVETGADPAASSVTGGPT
jgi:hypothetical protein